MYDLVTLGACNLDIFFASSADTAIAVERADGRERVAAEDVDAILDRLSRAGFKPAAICGGGQAGNVAAAAARFGLSVALVCRVGLDEFADRAVDDLHRVDLGYVRKSGRTTRAVVLVASDGDRTILVEPGVEEVLPEHLPQLSARHFHFTSTINRADHAKTIRWIGEMRRRASTSIDGGSLFAEMGGAALGDLYRGATLVFATEDELATLTGRSHDDAAQWLFEKGVEVVCRKEGAKGASVLTRYGEVYHEDALAATVLDTTGAGDALAGAFLAMYLRGRSLSDSLTEGVRYASASLSSWGRTGFPSRSSGTSNGPS